MSILNIVKHTVAVLGPMTLIAVAQALQGLTVFTIPTIEHAAIGALISTITLYFVKPAVTS